MEQIENIINEIMERLVFFADCDRCVCKQCKTGVTKLSCFEEHPGWVNISPHSIERTIREVLTKNAKNKKERL